ncbi:FAD-dependent oxidoreductase [Alphaproteobacteria bacterium]|nr:FAD-dependent oxidoreductase [Alphaproteobacteria bacterium]
MNKNKKILILGGGQAAAYASKEIRSIDTGSDVTIISEEKYLPYERPPLSKDYILDKVTFNNLLFFPKNFYVENNIKFIGSTKITKVDFDNKKISSSLNSYEYDQLLIATGSSNRHLVINGQTILPQENIIYLRDFEESHSLKEKMNKAKNITIIGGGFIGLEIASSAVQKGKNITVLERAEQLMGRVIPLKIANLIQEKHESMGTKINLNVEIKNIEQKNDAFTIHYNNETLLSDLIIIGVGSKPNTEIFQNTSLKIDNGILTDEFSATSIEDVFAAGDVSSFYHPFYQDHMRLESYKHAQNHGINAGKNLIGLKTSYSEIPWMWSDQFNLNLQLTGICNDYETSVQRGSNLEDGIIYFFLKNRKIMGACGLGVGGKIGRDIRLAGKLSEKKIKVTKELLSDINTKLNKI